MLSQPAAMTGEIIHAPEESLEDNLSADERRFVDLYLDIRNIARAALVIWPNIGYQAAAKRGQRAIRKAQGVIDVLFDDAGLTLVDIVEKIVAGTNAQRAILVKVDGNTKKKEIIGVPDYPMQHKYLETALKLKGLLNKDPEVLVVPQTIDNTQANVQNIYLQRGMLDEFEQFTLDKTSNLAKGRQVQPVQGGDE